MPDVSQLVKFLVNNRRSLSHVVPWFSNNQGDRILDPSTVFQNICNDRILILIFKNAQLERSHFESDLEKKQELQ